MFTLIWHLPQESWFARLMQEEGSARPQGRKQPTANEAEIRRFFAQWN